MSDCDTSGFGYVEREGDRLKVVFGDPHNPTIHYFCSTEIIQAIRLKELVEKEMGNYTKGFTLPDKEIKKLLQELLQKAKSEQQRLTEVNHD